MVSRVERSGFVDSTALVEIYGTITPDPGAVNGSLKARACIRLSFSYSMAQFGRIHVYLKFRIIHKGLKNIWG